MKTPREIAERIEAISTSISLHTVSKKAAKAVLESLVREAVEEAKAEQLADLFPVDPSLLTDGHLKKLLAQERERCAKMVEGWILWTPEHVKSLAAAIRKGEGEGK